MAGLATHLTSFMQLLLSLINTLLVPMAADANGNLVVTWTAITPIQILIWFGLIFSFVPMLFAFIRKMIN